MILLGKLNDTTAIPALALELQDETDGAIRRAATIALAKFSVVESLDLIEDYQNDPSAAVAQAAQEAVTKLRHQLADELYAESEAEADVPVVPGPVAAGQVAPPPAPFETGTVEPVLSLNQLSQTTVQVLLNEILERHQPLAWLELIRRVSRRFGRDYLIRVRQFVNRYVFPASARGEIRIEDDVLRLSSRRTWGRA